MLRLCRTPARRTLREFAEQEIVIPTGLYAGERFRCDTQPWTAHFFDAVDSGKFNRIFVVGCVQSGKTLTAFVIPATYHTFEGVEKVVIGIPDMRMAADKWREDIKPVIDRTRFSELMPRRGEGSKGGNVRNAVQFLNGATMKFMSGGGGDAARSGYTSRIVLVTEADKLREIGGASDETDKFGQMEARANSFGDDKLIMAESTASVTDGIVWHEYRHGTASKLLCPCPGCGEYREWERESLVGWQDADTRESAGELARWECVCGAKFGEDDRRAGNRGALLVHRGQSIEGGRVIGEPASRTLGFRYHAFHNLLWSTAYIAGEEWAAARSPNPEAATRKLLQFYWSRPADPDVSLGDDLQPMELCRRQIDCPRGVVPPGYDRVTAFCDLGKHWAHWVITAFAKDGTPHTVDYGEYHVSSNTMQIEDAINEALGRFVERVGRGLPRASGETVPVSLGVADAGNWTIPVCRALKAHDPRILPSRGFGIRQVKNWPHGPVHVKDMEYGARVIQANVDYWKTYARERMRCSLSQPGAWTLFRAEPSEHLAFAKQLLAEKREATSDGAEFWTQVEGRANHWGDAFVGTLFAAALCGVEYRGIIATPAPVRPAPRSPTRPDRPTMTSRRPEFRRRYGG